MYNYNLHQHINSLLQKGNIDFAEKDHLFHTRFIANAAAIHSLYMELYAHHPACNVMYDELLQTIITSYKKRDTVFKKKDKEKLKKGFWFLSNDIVGMSLYVDRFCGNIKSLNNKLDYFKKLGVNLLHLMPLFESPENESDGGYAVSNFRKVDERFGTLDDLKSLEDKEIFLMIDIVLNHTSHHINGRKKQSRVKKNTRIFSTCMMIETCLMHLNKRCLKFFLNQRLAILLT